MNHIKADFLFATPSFLSGAARLFDLHGAYDSYNGSFSPQEADYKALLSDWLVVGEDIRIALEKFDFSMSQARSAHPDVSSLVGEQMSFFP